MGLMRLCERLNERRFKQRGFHFRRIRLRIGPCDQHIVGAGLAQFREQLSSQCAQAAFDAIAYHGIAAFGRHRIANACALGARWPVTQNKIIGDIFAAAIQAQEIGTIL